MEEGVELMMEMNVESVERQNIVEPRGGGSQGGGSHGGGSQGGVFAECLGGTWRDEGAWRSLRADGAQWSRGRAESKWSGLTGRGGYMGLDARGEAGESVFSCQTGDWDAIGESDELHRVSGGGRAEEQDKTSGADGFRGLYVTSGGDWTRKSGYK